MRLIIVETIRTRMLRCTRPSERWLWCLRCERFFHADRLRRDRWGLRQACPQTGCTGSGFDLSIFFWDAYRDPEDTRWPSSTDQLENGMRSPDREHFHAERNHRRREAVISAFQSSRDYQDLDSESPAASHVRLLLELADGLWLDAEDIDGAMLGELVHDISRLRLAGRGSGGDAAGHSGSGAGSTSGGGAGGNAAADDRRRCARAIIAELTAFFTFAGRELDFEYASDCLDVLAGPAHAVLEEVPGPADASSSEPTAGSPPGHDIACACHRAEAASIH